MVRITQFQVNSIINPLLTIVLYTIDSHESHTDTRHRIDIAKNVLMDILLQIANETCFTLVSLIHGAGVERVVISRLSWLMS